ncbi:hypothetical protein [Microbacterium esteraromaticum]|uniref:hypothetical protein n=1 Tax=Microbacterium esteraromaticum TaxID=57043 RepID=UPI00195D0697|nr:hypothetical protein [Microbacterium esteraromaticum]MBM7465525.1 hypothetical protein [Microbacterium esteraromaticum]
MILVARVAVTPLPLGRDPECNGRMTHHNGNPDEHHDAAADAGQNDAAQTADEALPDGQFDSQQMPTTDGEPASNDDPAADAGAESQEEGDAAMRAAEEATKND